MFGNVLSLFDFLPFETQASDKDFAAKDAPTPMLTFLFVVNGPCYERERRRSAWAAFDRAYIKRRDGLARCIAAALWGDSNKARNGGPKSVQNQSQGATAVDCSPQSLVRCLLLFEEDNILVELGSSGFTRLCKVRHQRSLRSYILRQARISSLSTHHDDALSFTKICFHIAELH